MVTPLAIRRFVSRLLGDRRGAAAVEYGLIIALIVLAMVAGLSSVADITVGMWGNVSQKVTKAGS
jgi:pilus assembly protein Flp/PilA